MKTVLASIALSLAMLAAHAQDTWSGSDKKLHLGVSAAVGFAAVNQWPNDKPKAFMVAMIPGTLKELSDAQRGGSGFSAKDLVVDAIGAAIGVYAGGWLISNSRGVTTVAYSTTIRGLE